MARVNIVGKDNVNYEQKKQLIDSFGYFRRTHWERATVIDVLEDNKDYLDHIAEDKVCIGSKSDTSIFGHDIESTLYTDLDEENLVYATVAHRKDLQNASANQQYIDGPNENFVFSSVFQNSNVSTETGKGNRQLSMLESIQLFRYDPTGSFKHNNSNDVFEIYKAAYGEEMANAYRYFFTEEVDFPHFHFSNRTMAETYGKTSEADAISLDKLIEYVKTLMHIDKNTPHILNTYDFDMPFLKIKNKKSLYKTAINHNVLRRTLGNYTVNEHLKNIFKNIETIGDGEVVLVGLEAVYADLVLLKILRSGDTGLGLAVNPHSPNNGDDNLNFNGGNTLSFMSTANFSGNGGPRKFRNRNEGDFENTKYEVTTAELQLASKIASMDRMNLKSVKHTKKLHFEEAKFFIDQECEELLREVLTLCESKKGEGYESSLQ